YAVIRGDGERDLGGVQRLQQPPLLLQEEVCLGHQLLDVPLQLRLPEVDMLQSLSQVPRPLSLGAQSPGLGFLIQCFGLMANPLGVVSVSSGLVKGREVIDVQAGGGIEALLECDLFPRKHCVTGHAIMPHGSK
uniref:Uncharacterized protein n=1 Tax=Oncorhynchus kisutch TaxID=8019 RepID=A0A8C7K314_ONCKI